jgi:ADP-ribose pyrophosphatase
VGFERVGSEEVWRGNIAAVRVDSFRHDDGEVVTREIVEHPGAVTVLPFDGSKIWLVRQPREPVGAQSLLELPAGKLDVEDEDPLQTARRELSEEIGKGAHDWRRLVSIYNSPGILSEINHLFLAQDLYDEQLVSEEEERIEIVALPVERLDDAIQDLRDAKTLIGLLWFRAFLRQS